MLLVFEKKRNMSLINRCLCLMLCLLLLPLTACDTKKASNTPTVLMAADFASETYPVEQAYLAPMELRYSAFSEEQAVHALAMTVCGEELAVLVRSMAEDGIHYQTQLCFFDQTGMETRSFCLETQLQTDDVTVSYIAGTQDGVTAYVTFFDAAIQKIITELCFFDTSGNMLRDAVPLTFTDKSFSPTGLSVLQSKETVISGICSEGNVFYVYDRDMNHLYSISGDQLTGKILESGSDVYVESRDMSDGTQKDILYKVDMETGKLTSSIDVSQITGTWITASRSGQLYAEDTTSLYRIDLDGKKINTLVNWSDIDLDRAVYSFVSPICVLSDDVVCMLGTSRDLGYDLGQVVMLIRQDNNPNMGKQTLILGGFGIDSDTNLLSTIDAFNQSNDQFRIELKDYLVDVDYSQGVEKFEKDFELCRQQMYLDVFTGKGPDIIYSNVQWYTAMNSLAVYEASDLLMDLYPLMENDPEFDINNFLPNVIEASTIDGQLCKIPVLYEVRGITGISSITNGITSWTTDEFDQIASTLPSGMQMLVNMTKLELLKDVLAGSINSFIDPNTNEASFDTDEFCKMLKWANTYGEEEPASAEERIYVDPQMLINNGQLACNTYDILRDTFFFSDYIPRIFGTTPDIIGYPSPTKNGPYIFPVEQIAISSWCDNPEGAWSFVKYLLTEDYQTQNSADYAYAYALGSGYGFPVRTDSLQSIIQLAMDPPDIERGGEQDPNATPIILTQEQADECLAVINSADTLYYLDLEIYAIIQEEAQAYFHGQKTVEEVAALIQNRVQTLVYERG